MAEDICRKSAIIETYVMDSRIGNTHTQTHTVLVTDRRTDISGLMGCSLSLFSLRYL